MGFYSWDCKVCGHPMLSGHASNSTNNWMEDVVVVTTRGKVMEGNYDGYGRVDGEEINAMSSGAQPACYHEHCWKHVGSPTKWDKGSVNSKDQGFFFDQDEHDVTEAMATANVKEKR
jgi:hypothetical protein